MITKLFSRMFDAANSKEDELLKQVQADLNTAAKEGKVETEQLSYESSPKEGVINVVDKTNNETTQFVPKDDDGFEMKTADQTFMIPKLVEVIEKLNDKVNSLGDGNKSPGKEVEAPSSAENTNAAEGKPEPKTDDDSSKQDTEPKPKKEEKSESAAHPDQKVMLQIDGEYRTGYVIEEQDGGKVKVKIPSMDNAFVIVSKASLSNVSKEEPERPKRTADEYISFSGRKFVVGGKQRIFAKPVRRFSTGTYAVFVDFGNSKQEPYAKADNPFNIKEKDQCLEDGFKSLDEANVYINSHQKELRDRIKTILSNKQKVFGNSGKYEIWGDIFNLGKSPWVADDSSHRRSGIATLKKGFKTKVEAEDYLKDNMQKLIKSLRARYKSFENRTS